MRAHAYRDGNNGRFLCLKINALLAIGGLGHSMSNQSLKKSPDSDFHEILYRCKNKKYRSSRVLYVGHGNLT